MADKLFRSYLVETREKLRNDLTNPDMSVDEILDTAAQIKAVEMRIKRVDNPPQRKKKASVETPVEALVEAAA